MAIYHKNELSMIKNKLYTFHIFQEVKEFGEEISEAEEDSETEEGNDEWDE